MIRRGIPMPSTRHLSRLDLTKEVDHKNLLIGCCHCYGHYTINYSNKTVALHIAALLSHLVFSLFWVFSSVWDFAPASSNVQSFLDTWFPHQRITKKTSRVYRSRLTAPSPNMSNIFCRNFPFHFYPFWHSLLHDLSLRVRLVLQIIDFMCVEYLLIRKQNSRRIFLLELCCGLHKSPFFSPCAVLWAMLQCRPAALNHVWV